MKYLVSDREGNVKISKESYTVSFLYGTMFGRFFVKILSFPIFSKIIGWFLNTRLSKFKIKSFVRKNNIDLNFYEKSSYDSFNAFFTRKIKKDNLDVDMDKSVFISPCDAKLSCYTISNDSEFLIKETYYSVSDLLNNDPIYKKYIGGYLLVLRLCADDYHRYIYLDSGCKNENIFIKGKLNTVRPIALKHFNIYKENSREYTLMHTENFGDIVQVEVGAVLVGKINNFHQEYEFKRGEEKGMFEFGGSTIVLLIEKDKVKIDDDIIFNSNKRIETSVKIGKRIGKSLKK